MFEAYFMIAVKKYLYHALCYTMPFEVQWPHDFLFSFPEYNYINLYSNSIFYVLASYIQIRVTVMEMWTVSPNDWILNENVHRFLILFYSLLFFLPNSILILSKLKWMFRYRKYIIPSARNECARFSITNLFICCFNVYKMYFTCRFESLSLAARLGNREQFLFIIFNVTCRMRKKNPISILI